MQKKIYIKAYVSYYIDLQVATSHSAVQPTDWMIEFDDSSFFTYCSNSITIVAIKSQIEKLVLHNPDLQWHQPFEECTYTAARKKSW